MFLYMKLSMCYGIRSKFNANENLAVLSLHVEILAVKGTVHWRAPSRPEWKILM